VYFDYPDEERTSGTFDAVVLIFLYCTLEPYLENTVEGLAMICIDAEKDIYERVGQAYMDEEHLHTLNDMPERIIELI
jgi:hypothetical protein